MVPRADLALLFVSLAGCQLILGIEDGQLMETGSPGGGVTSMGGGGSAGEGGIGGAGGTAGSCDDESWSLGFSGSGVLVTADDVVTDGTDIIVAGQFDGTVDFGIGGPVSPSGSPEAAFVMKLDCHGAVQWVTICHGSRGVGVDSVPKLALHSDGTIALVGQTQDSTLKCGIEEATLANPDSDAYVALLSSGGVVQWVKRFDGGAVDRAAGVAFDTAGDLIVAGDFEGTINDLGGISAVGHSAFVAKLGNETGGTMWALQTAGAGADRATGLTTNGTDAFVIGDFVSELAWGCDPQMTPQMDPNGYVARISSSGVCQWARAINSVDVVIPFDVAHHANGLSVAGQYQANTGLVAFSGSTVTLSATADVNAFVALLGVSEGIATSAAGFGPMGMQIGVGLSRDGSLLLVNHDAELDVTQADVFSSAEGPWDTRIVVLEDETSATGVIPHHDPSDPPDWGNEVATDDRGATIVVGYFANTMVSLSGTVLQSSGPVAAFVTRVAR